MRYIFEVTQQYWNDNSDYPSWSAENDPVIVEVYEISELNEIIDAANNKIINEVIADKVEELIRLAGKIESVSNAKKAYLTLLPETKLALGIKDTEESYDKQLEMHKTQVESVKKSIEIINQNPFKKSPWRPPVEKRWVYKEIEVEDLDHLRNLVK